MVCLLGLKFSTPVVNLNLSSQMKRQTIGFAFFIDFKS